jgi:hypothetical protein
VNIQDRFGSRFDPRGAKNRDRTRLSSTSSKENNEKKKQHLLQSK